MNGEKASLQLGNQTADSTEDAHGILAITLMDITQIDLFKSAVVTNFEGAQAGDLFYQGCFFGWALRKVLLVETPVYTKKSMLQSKFFELIHLGDEVAASQFKIVHC
jgi:hypothetical protein